MSKTDSISEPKIKKSLLTPLIQFSHQNLKLFNFSIEIEEKFLKLTLNLSSKLRLVDAISEVLKEISKEHPLDQNPNNYDIYISKKNGLPRTDFPSFQIDLTLEETGNNNFSIVHITYQEVKPKRKSTLDITNHYSKVIHQKQQDDTQIKQSQNWLFRFLGCQ